MSVVLIGADEEWGPAVVERLLNEDDIVGVIEEELGRRDLWKGLGAHVALGSAADPDLVERAVQHARSIVVFEGDPQRSTEVLEAVFQGARLAPGETARILFVTSGPATTAGGALDASAFDYVVLRVPRKGLLRRSSSVAPADLAEAVSAADDMAGDPRLHVDLGSPEGWRALGLDPR